MAGIYRDSIQNDAREMEALIRALSLQRGDVEGAADATQDILVQSMNRMGELSRQVPPEMVEANRVRLDQDYIDRMPDDWEKQMALRELLFGKMYKGMTDYETRGNE